MTCSVCGRDHRQDVEEHVTRYEADPSTVSLYRHADRCNEFVAVTVPHEASGAVWRYQVRGVYVDPWGSPMSGLPWVHGAAPTYRLAVEWAEAAATAWMADHPKSFPVVAP